MVKGNRNQGIKGNFSAVTGILERSKLIMNRSGRVFRKGQSLLDEGLCSIGQISEGEGVGSDGHRSYRKGWRPEARGEGAPVNENLLLDDGTVKGV